MKSTYLCLWIILLLTNAFLLPFDAHAYDREAYEAAKDSYNRLNSAYSQMQSKIDATYSFFERFHRGVNTWRNAVTKETQNRGIEEIDKLADDQIESVIDSLFDEAKSSLGLPEEITIPQGMKEKAIEKLREKFKGNIPPRLANKLGYMYTLSALDRKLRDNYIYENLGYIKQGLDKGSSLLRNFKNAIKFIDTFSPQGVEPSPVGRLKKVKDFLGILSDIAKPIPLMGDIIDGYAKATEGFMAALNDLDQKLKDARHGSLCGQKGVDVDIQEAFQRAYTAEDCLTYFALYSSQYPHLSPIRAWEGGSPTKVYLWYNGEGTMLKGTNFEIMYRYFASLKEGSYSNLASQEHFMNLAKAAGDSNLSAIADRFKGYYQRFNKDYGFREALELEGLYKSGQFISLQGRTIDYLGHSEDEFGGLCFFNSTFRGDIEALYNKYKDAYVINGTIKPSVRGMAIGNLSVLIDGTNARELKCAVDCSFRHLALSNNYTVQVKAEGFKEIKRTFTKDRYPLITLEAATLKIETDKATLLPGERVWLRALVEGRDTSRDRFFWSANGKPIGGYGDRVEYIPVQSGIHNVSVTLVDERGRPVLEGRHSITVMENLSISITGPAEAQAGEEITLSAKSITGTFQQAQANYGYTWSVNNSKYGGNESYIRIKFDKPGNQSIKVTLWQWIADQRKWQKVGEASHFVIVKSPAQSLSLPLSITGPTSGYEDNDFIFYANLENTYRLGELIKDAQPRISFSWSLNGRPYGGNESTQRIRFHRPGRNSISVAAWVWLQNEKKWLKIGEGKHSFEAFKQLYTSPGYTLKTPPPSQTPYPTAPPAPLQTPKATITPTPKPTPTPPPRVRQFSELTQEEQKAVLDCLCRCNSTATSSVAVYYDAKPDNASPACSDTSNGPCVNKGFGCWRHVPVNTGQCAEGCYKRSNVQGVPANLMNAGK